MTYTIQGGAPLRAWAKLSTTDDTVILSEKNATIIGVYATNVTGNTPTLEYFITDGTDENYLRGAKAMTAYEMAENELIMPIGDDEEFVAKAGTADEIYITVVYLSGDGTAKGSGL